MVTEHIVILELIAFLVVVVLISIVVWRDKTKQVVELNDLNEALLFQIEELQGVLGERKDGDNVLHAEIDKISSEVDEQLLHSIDDSAEKWSQMERLMTQKSEALDQLMSADEGLDREDLQKKLKELQKLLAETERKIKIQVKEISIARKNTKGLRQKLKELSKKLIKLGSLELKEARMQKDKERLKKRVADFKERLEHQKFINKKLENELKTSFRGDEVQDMRNNLKKTEEDLRQALTEKKFIEQHFIDLEENNKDQAELHAELQRANREIQMLEKTVMEIDAESD